MDARGNIYEFSDEEIKEPISPQVEEDTTRLLGFLKARADEDKVKHEKFVKRHGKLIWDSQKQGPYKKHRPSDEY